MAAVGCSQRCRTRVKTSAFLLADFTNVTTSFKLYSLTSDDTVFTHLHRSSEIHRWTVDESVISSMSTIPQQIARFNPLMVAFSSAILMWHASSGRTQAASSAFRELNGYIQTFTVDAILYLV
uniref:Uncharacterized protein n=1 Tax=Trichuris muris TaxID=70415 RepID=A0A5S6QI29_TRIMR